MIKWFRYLVCFFILLGVIYTSGCKKYDEDDVFIQWKRPEKRLIKYGPWVFEKLTVDGVDKSDEFRLDSAYFDYLHFKEHAEYSTDLNVSRTVQRSEKGTYDFIDNKSILRITMLPALPNNGDFHNYGPIFKITAIDWEILRLSKKGLTLKVEYNSSIYILYLKSNND